MIILINGLHIPATRVRVGRGRRDGLRGFLGRALKTGEPSLSLPCFAERRYGGVPDEEMLMALSRRSGGGVVG